VYQRCLYAVLPESVIDEKVNSEIKEAPDLIVNVVTLFNQWLPVEATIREWRQQFAELIEQLRESMVEY